MGFRQRVRKSFVCVCPVGSCGVKTQSFPEAKLAKEAFKELEHINKVDEKKKPHSGRNDPTPRYTEPELITNVTLVIEPKR